MSFLFRMKLATSSTLFHPQFAAPRNVPSPLTMRTATSPTLLQPRTKPQPPSLSI
ncbi:hypothetical protein P154DRAFT_365950 [Amniculicola lignicola CBS 123094]|uniref:Uncharacterized protein n=1 Tax=Amniculicola lignicola CBS 123094 TaxID=1392246 RepID=A0A6A5VZ84_9PLEO|nr:hypothetical protein P154DRAFT_365950 [Amniculicola lignicola CBS 123094]